MVQVDCSPQPFIGLLARLFTSPLAGGRDKNCDRGGGRDCNDYSSSYGYDDDDQCCRSGVKKGGMERANNISVLFLCLSGAGGIMIEWVRCCKKGAGESVTEEGEKDAIAGMVTGTVTITRSRVTSTSPATPPVQCTTRTFITTTTTTRPPILPTTRQDGLPPTLPTPPQAMAELDRVTVRAMVPHGEEKTSLSPVKKWKVLLVV